VHALRRSTSSAPTRRTFLICAGLAALTLALYWRATRFPFITYDDRLYVSENRHVLTGLSWSNFAWAFTSWHTGNWHPLTWLSLMLDAQLFGKSAGGFHLTNVLLHTANAVVLFLVLRRLSALDCSRRPAGDARASRRDAATDWRSAFVAALFALHPVHVESVAWISERKDVLSAFFFLLALGAYARYAARPTLARYALITLVFVLGLLAKSMLVTLPIILLLLDYWPLRRLRRNVDLRRLIIEKLPLFVMAAVFSAVTFLAQRSAGSTMPMTIFPLRTRLANALLACERYLGKLFWPRDLTLPYPFSRSINAFELCWAAVLLAGLSFVAIKAARQRGYLFIGWLWFVGMLVPVIGIVQVGPQAMADRYMYLPAVGIFIAITWGIADRASAVPKHLRAGFASAVLFVLGTLCFAQLGYWKNSETLFRHTLAIYPGEIVSLRNLTSAYVLEHRPRDAITTLELLLAQVPQDATGHLHLAQALQQSGDEPRAADEYAAVLRFAGADRNVTGPALNNLAWIRATSADAALRNGAEAMELAERSCSLSPNPDAGALDTLAAAYAESGDFERARATAERALNLAQSARNEALAAQISEHVDLYRQHMPVRDR
jgi:tetratricopeptide (TPR) repeat protein